MTENDDASELLFFDTFSHEVDTDINLDLVQFPKPVYITQVRIIPLGARVQADFPGGVRLGATNPSKFDIQFFVNDLGVQNASTFENFGRLQYDQNDCIHLECTPDKIPTDGLVLRGWYSTITLAVYGILTNSINDSIASPPPPVCDTSAQEDISSMSGDNRSAAVQDETLKEEWKEPPTGDMPHAHKTSTSDYERDDMDYGISREHYHHSGDEREHRLRKTSRSSERSASRNRTHSESNEREYSRRSERVDKRDWSRSPDYPRHSRRKHSDRSRSDAEDHKWPRTPPASIDSPTRPRSPDTLEYADDDMHYKLKSRKYRRSSESLSNTAQESQMLDDEDTPGTPGEQFEPILSDDEIIGDDDSNTATSVLDQTANDEPDVELEAAIAATETYIVEFDPFKMPTLKYAANLHVYYYKEIESLKSQFRKFDTQTKCNSLKIFKDASTTDEERENYVFLTEQLINQLAYLAQKYRRRNFVVQEAFESEEDNLEQAFIILQISLDFECACLQTQPAFKIRHIKMGAKLAELLGFSSRFMEYLLKVRQFDPFDALFQLYQQDYMALSIKLMILRGIYALLDTRIGVTQFIEAKLNGYQLVLEKLQHSHLTRTKYGLQAIIRKLNLNEAMDCIHEFCKKLFMSPVTSPNELADIHKMVEQAMRKLLEALIKNALSYQQPKRFLPVSKKFEIVADTSAHRSFALAVQAYLVQNSLAESLLALLANASELPQSLFLCCLQLLEAMLQSHVCLDYFVDDCFETTQTLIAILLGVDELPVETVEESAGTYNAAKEDCKKETEVNREGNVADVPVAEVPEIQPESEKEDMQTVSSEEKSLLPVSTVVEEILPPVRKQPLHRMQKIGVALAFKVQTRYHLDAIVELSSGDNYDTIKLATHLHALYSQSCSSPGRQHTVEVISMSNNLQIFMGLIKIEQRLQAQRHVISPGAKYKSPVLSYAIDLIDCCVRHCENVEYLIEYGARLLELAKSHDTFEPSVSAVLQEMFVYLKPLEAANIFSYDDTTAVVEVITRSLEYITTLPGDLITGLRILRHLALGPSSRVLKSSETEELKQRFVTLHFYAADGAQTLIQIMEKICAYFEQPGLHAPALMTMQGLLCCQILLPSLQMLREMLSYAIHCRDVEFKDLTAIDHLMRAYYLLFYFPTTCQAAREVEMAKQEIISILLAYTQPHELDEDSLHKSLWTQMVREVLKNIDGPSMFIPGLQVLSELIPLPLPLPLPSDPAILTMQAQRFVMERKLWSAHLHPQSTQIAKLIETISPSSFPPLIDLLIRVCLQLADLAPNMTLLISKTLTDLLWNEWAGLSNSPSTLLLRQLFLFGRLTAYASLKSSALSILSGKLWDLFQTLLTIMMTSDVGLRCQTAVHRILENFLDSEISLISPQSTATPALNLASALPPKELVPRIAEAIMTNLLNTDVNHEVATLAVRNLIILTEHDYTFHHLYWTLRQKAPEFQLWLEKVVKQNEKEDINFAIIENALLLLLSLTQIDENSSQESIIPSRTLKLNSAELAHLIHFRNDVSTPHAIQRLFALLTQNKEACNEVLLVGIQNIIAQLTALDSNAMDVDDEQMSVEPCLPQTEGIVTQYAARPIFLPYDTSGDCAQFTSRFWLHIVHPDHLFGDHLEAHYERIPCDLEEVSAAYLLADTNLTTDCKRILHLSASPQSNRERTPTAPCFRTRRVEVEPSTGRPEKKIYITPVRGRGFPRAPPTRGDLFRSRPPNTSRPPSLHVDDFLALETCGAQPTGPTGYNKISPIIRGSRVGRSRGSRIAAAVAYRKAKAMRTSSPSWSEMGSPYRGAAAEPHFGGDLHYSVPSHFGRLRARCLRSRSYMR